VSERKDYDRPNQQWECGWKKQGFSCNGGPSKTGKCLAQGDCQPSKDEQGYHCTRLPQHGGTCSSGPLPSGECSCTFPPCSPHRSLRVKRKLFSAGFVALVIALLFIGLGGSKFSEESLSPGPLSSRHSAITQRCSACHSQAHNQPWYWFSSTPAKSISENCQGCHTMGVDSLHAHSLPVTSLKALALKISDKRATEKDGMHAAALSSKIQCAACHKEHKGKSFRMTDLSNSQCQSCHEQDFTSFSKGHPEFTNYPFNRRVNILFDHNSHFGKHFAKKKVTDITCKSCHMPSPSGGKMVIKSFDASCAKCHNDQIYGESAVNKGIIFFALPAMDVETLEEKGIEIGGWPVDADGEIPPMMRLMLSKDANIASILDEFVENDIELDDLSDEDQETLEKVANVAWAIKRLLKKLAGNGLGEFSDILRELGAKDIETKKLSDISGSLPVDVVRAAGNDWFPGLESELNDHANGSSLPVIEDTDELADIEDEGWMKAGGWYRSNGDFTIRYRPRGHGDTFIQSWISLTAGAAHKASVAGDVFASLTDRKKSPGKCMKCHSIEKVSGVNIPEFYRVHWKGALNEDDKQNFSRFNHSAHLNLIKDKGCMTCHSMNKKADFKLAYEGVDATKFESNFHPIKKSTCIQCHQSGQVSESCTTCHRYHIGDFFTSKALMKKIRTELKAD